jgi:hypothetical protein
MFEQVANIASKTTQTVRLRSLTNSELRIYQFMFHLLVKKYVPFCVPLAYCSRCTGLSVRQCKYGLGKLVKKGIIERFVKYNSPVLKSPSFYRLIRLPH